MSRVSAVVGLVGRGWVEAKGFAFLMSSQEMLMLLAQETYFENHLFGPTPFLLQFEVTETLKEKVGCPQTK